MKNVRVFYSKKGRMKFISHLDMNRFMTRMILKSGLPVWYTEGFNPRPYLTFALPLSLGFESEYDIMDIRVNDDNIGNEQILNDLSAVMPEDIKILKVAEPKLKAGKVAFAEFSVDFDIGTGAFLEKVLQFSKSPSILVEKKTKKGTVKEIDIAPKIKECNISNGKIILVLPAGSDDNLNPTLFIDAFFAGENTDKIPFLITRTKIFDANMNLFE